MKRAQIAALTILLAAGIGAAMLTFPAGASAWSWTSLPDGYGVSSGNLGNGCYHIKISGTDLGSTCDAGFQSRLDAYVNSTICTVNPAAGQAQGLCAPATTEATTTQATTTAATTTTQATTTTDQGTATTADAPQASPPAATQDATTTTDVAAQITALQTQLAALTDRVDSLEYNVASEQAFQDALADGDTAPQAALAARSAGLNALHLIG